MAYDNIKSHKIQGFILSLEDIFFEKPQGRGRAQIYSPSHFRCKSANLNLKHFQNIFGRLLQGLTMVRGVFRTYSNIMIKLIRENS